MKLRTATPADIKAIESLIERSATSLCAADYTPAQIRGALRGAFGVDSQLIEDRTYFVVEKAGELVACGGWSYRRTLFGGDAEGDRDAGVLEPPADAAKIRAFFVDPASARKGLGKALLEHCEREAAARAFTRCELMATRSGERLYAAFGYQAAEPIAYDLGDGLTIDFVPMTKRLG